MIESTIHLNIHDKDKWGAAYKKYSFIQPFFEDDVQLTVLAKKHGIPLRTAKRWVKNYRESGIAGLLGKGRNPYGVRISEELQKIIEGLALRTPRLSIAAIQRAIKPAAVKNNELIPSYSTIYRIIRALDPSLLELAHNGPKTYMDKYDLVHRTEAERPNAIWQADHTFLDVLVKDGKQLKKPWLTIILDDYSRAIAGYAVSFAAPSAIQTALAFRHAKIAPYKRWSMDGFIPRMPESLSELDMLLLTVPDTRIVQKDGIRFSGFKYIHSTLAGYVGEKISIRYDPRDVAEISVFHKEEFVCRAICTDLAGETVSLGEIQSARKRQLREQQAKINDRTKVTNELLNFRTLTEEENLEVQEATPRPKTPSKLKSYHNE